MAGSSNHNQFIPWGEEYEYILEVLDVDPDEGLTEEEVKRRRKEEGYNRLRTKGKKSAWSILIEQFKNIIIWILIISAGVSVIFGEYIDAIAVLVVIILNTMIGFFTELRAVRSMEALREMTEVDARVRRNGTSKMVSAEQLVPGDVVLVEGGDVVTADLRLVQASKLQANESTLTGESKPVSKKIESINEDSPLAERNNMLFKGTAVTRGSGVGIAVHTGMDTELGQISELVAEAEEEHTPLEKRLDQLGERLVWFTLGIIVIVAVTGILRGKELLLMIETAVALAVAAVPEGLPIVATIALARGMRRMAENNALINRLASVETLGGTNVICTDKTGTLTENQMTVTRYVLGSGQVDVSGEGLETQGDFLRENNQIDPDNDTVLNKAIQVGVLCSNASLHFDEDNQLKAIGEPVEIALLVAGRKAGIQRSEITKSMSEEREVAFDPEIKMMATFHKQNDGFFVAVKGAPEAVLVSSSRIQVEENEFEDIREEDRSDWMATNEVLASDGLRLLGLAYKTVDSVDDDPYAGLTFLGLVAMLDPPREDVRESIQVCKDAGIIVSMVTGDQAITAKKIASAVGLIEDDDPDTVLGNELKPPEDLDHEKTERIVNARVLARVSPKQKLDLISIHQNQGSIVAMTGDGVNDAPALKKADIGIAMGRRGTQVAREASDMVLEDDAFSTIVLAVRLGRVIFNNIRRFVLYLISCNVSEILVVFGATLFNLPLPILPLQILFLNLVTDVFPALALGVSKGDPSEMEHPPRDPDESILMRKHWFEISGFSLIITISVLAAFGIASLGFDMDNEKVVTVSFLTLAFAQLWHVFNMRDAGSQLINNDIVRNAYVWGAVALCTGLLLLAVYFPPLSNILEIVNPGLRGWGLILGLSIIPLILGQVYRSLIQEAQPLTNS